MRYPFPQCFGDPSFIIMVQHCINNDEFLTEYQRLTGASFNLNPSKQDATFLKLAEFIHKTVYLKIPQQTGE